jgi:putative endonuclease
MDNDPGDRGSLRCCTDFLTSLRTSCAHARLRIILIMHGARVYILTNNRHTGLYVGFTNNLVRRLWEHRTKRRPKCFTARYNIHKLVYYEGFGSIVEAIAREKLIKGIEKMERGVDSENKSGLE